MALTTKQIYDLNNAMVANQSVALGTLVSDYIIDNKVASGSVVPTAFREIVTTGLTTVRHAVASFSGSPTLNAMFVTATAGSVAGEIILNTFVPTNGSTVTPIAASGSSNYVAVEWIAIGS